MPSVRGLRLARSVMFAAVCVVVSGMGHAVASGSGVPMWTLAYSFGCVTAGAWWFTGREHGVRALTGATVVVQGALHCLFMLGQMLPPPQAGDAATYPDGMSGMVMADPGRTTAAVPSVPGAGGHAMAMHEWSPGMLAVHAAVAVLSGLWLWRGEVALHRLGRALAAFLTRPVRRARRLRTAVVLPARPPAPPLAGEPPVRRPAQVWLRHFVVRRGPPRIDALHRLAPV
ncbi:hypothetical protein [Streptomyces sp. NPDC008139]|uniref:hypothetical protein n=1 Tax=Streptomyces sp. NPDC008139 TaxID=3364814 RepID=UPI0036E8D0BF